MEYSCSQDQSCWLGFSLSNHQHMPASDSSHLCLFQPFNSDHCGVIDRSEEDANEASNPSLILTGGGPKLEDFLGSGGSTSIAVAGSADLSQYSTETPMTVSPGNEIYESELKIIAASFLREFSGGQGDTHMQLTTTAAPEPVAAKKTVETFGQRTSIYRGVTRHRWTGRYEAHLWDNSCRREGQSRKGRQVYLGGYDKEEKAARAYDLAALKYWGPTTTTNFPLSEYEKELEEMKHMTRQEFVASLRRKSSGFSRGASIYRGVTRHHQHGRWQARIGRVAGNKDLYLGTFSSQEEAAEAYDIAAIKFRGLNAVTNFDISRYDVKSIASTSLPVGGTTTASAGKSKTFSDSDSDNKNDSGSRVPFSAVPLSTLPTITKQDNATQSSDSWSFLGYNTKSTPSPIPTLFHASTKGTLHQGTTPFSMDFSTSATATTGGGMAAAGKDRNNDGSLNSIIPFPASTSYNHEGSSSYGNWWAAQPLSSLRSFQLPAKPNLSLLQTPIFGME